MSVKANMNTLKRMNEKMYSKLSASERFKMVMKTFVNGDDVQREKLVKSCPKVIYSESDRDYTERIEASRDITTVFIVQLLEYDKIISTMKILNGFNCKAQELNDEFRVVNEVQAFLLAFELFCEEHLGIESIDMIQAWYGYDERYTNKVERIKQFISFYQIDHNTELKEIWLEEVFLNVWRTRVKD